MNRLCATLSSAMFCFAFDKRGTLSIDIQRSDLEMWNMTKVRNSHQIVWGIFLSLILFTFTWIWILFRLLKFTIFAIQAYNFESLRPFNFVLTQNDPSTETLFTLIRCCFLDQLISINWNFLSYILKILLKKYENIIFRAKYESLGIRASFYSQRFISSRNDFGELIRLFSN